MKRLIVAVLATAGLAFMAIPVANAAPQRATVTCRANLLWQVSDPTNGFLLQGNNNWVTTDPLATNTWCQIDTGYTLQGFHWFEYSNDGGQHCLTDNDSQGEKEDMVNCQGLASQEWTATGQMNCGGHPGNPNACEWILGNAYALIHYGSGKAMTDNGTGNTVSLVTYNGAASEIWWGLT